MKYKFAAPLLVILVACTSHRLPFRGGLFRGTPPGTELELSCAESGSCEGSVRFESGDLAKALGTARHSLCRAAMVDRHLEFSFERDPHGGCSAMLDPVQGSFDDDFGVLRGSMHWERTQKDFPVTLRIAKPHGKKR